MELDSELPPLINTFSKLKKKYEGSEAPIGVTMQVLGSTKQTGLSTGAIGFGASNTKTAGGTGFNWTRLIIIT